MKKKLGTIWIMFCLLLSIAGRAHAETAYGDAGWEVTFTQDKKMSSNFRTADLDDVIYGLQPGDQAILVLALKNENEATTDWYMTNEVLYSLEDRSLNSATGGGAYTYRLTYRDKEGKVTTLFDSDTVGGDTISKAGEGLHEATDALKEYFHLDTLGSQQGGFITLEVALDGETQGNDYQDTLADIQMNFAVELREAGKTTTSILSNSPRVNPRSTRTIGTVRTGDETKLTLFIVITCISGLLLFGVSCYGIAERRKQKKGE